MTAAEQTVERAPAGSGKAFHRALLKLSGETFGGGGVGVDPVIVQRIGDVLVALKKRGMTILLVEQNFRFAATVADRSMWNLAGRVATTRTSTAPAAAIAIRIFRNIRFSERDS